MSADIHVIKHKSTQEQEYRAAVRNIAARDRIMYEEYVKLFGPEMAFHILIKRIEKS